MPLINTKAFKNILGKSEAFLIQRMYNSVWSKEMKVHVAIKPEFWLKMTASHVNNIFIWVEELKFEILLKNDKMWIRNTLAIKSGCRTNNLAIFRPKIRRVKSK